jgi:hypothetical protein
MTAALISRAPDSAVCALFDGPWNGWRRRSPHDVLVWRSSPDRHIAPWLFLDALERGSHICCAGIAISWIASKRAHHHCVEFC